MVPPSLFFSAGTSGLVRLQLHNSCWRPHYRRRYTLRLCLSLPPSLFPHQPVPRRHIQTHTPTHTRSSCVRSKVGCGGQEGAAAASLLWWQNAVWQSDWDYVKTLMKSRSSRRVAASACKGGAEPEISRFVQLSLRPPTFRRTCARACALLELFVGLCVAEGGWEPSSLLIAFQHFPLGWGMFLSSSTHRTVFYFFFLLIANLIQRSAACKFPKIHQQIRKSCSNKESIHISIFWLIQPVGWG